MRWGVLGVAGINRAMLPALLAAEGSDVVGIASRTPERADAAAAANGIRAFHGYEALLADPDVEAVYLPLPNALHAPWVIAAVEAGKHVLCEKPMAITADEARTMTDAAAANGVLLAEAYMYAHHPRFELIAAILASGELGAVRAIDVAFTFDASDELDHSGFAGAPGSGAIYDVGGYAVHSSRLLLGAEPQAVTATSAVSDLHGGIDMSTAMLLEFAGGIGVTARVSMWSADRDTIEITGQLGSISVPHAFLCGPADGDFTVTVGEQSRTVTVPAVDHYVSQVEDFTRAVRGLAPLRFGPQDAIAGAAVLEALTRSRIDRARVVLG